MQISTLPHPPGLLNRDEVVLRCNASFSCSTTGEKHMFRWLNHLVYGRGNAECFEELFAEDDGVTSYLDSISPTYKAWQESQEKRDLLAQKLDDAEWVLEYEKRLAKLRKKTAAQRSKGEQSGIDTDRLRRLEHHLAGLRRSLD
jgi:hypothetical protein